jgi:integral membrane sensor domain MASE1
MSSKQTKIVFLVVVGVIVCWQGMPPWGGSVSSQNDLQVSGAALQFNADEAYRTTKEFVTRNPRRILGSLEAWQAAADILGSFKQLGYDVRESDFDAVIAGRRQTGRNILAFKAGASPEILAVVAHYDTARTTFQGAMDDGAGVGVLLELARVFAQSPPRRSLLLIASDGEEWGQLGAADIATHYPERQRIAAVLSLDGVSVGDLSGFRLDEDGQLGGFAPAWLRRIAYRAAEVQGLPVVCPFGWQEYVQRAFALSLADQGPFLNAGIPAINLGSESVDETRARAILNSQDDTIDNLKTASIGMYGQAAERILRSIDGLSSTLFTMDEAFAWSNYEFVRGWSMRVLQYLDFLPLLMMFVFGFWNCRRSFSVEKMLVETLLFVTWLAPFMLGYSMIQICRIMHWLPHTSLYPAPFKDPILASPAWGVLATVVAISALFGIGLHLLVRFTARSRKRTFAFSRVSSVAILLIVAVISLHYSPYWAVTFLALPALVWPAVGRGRNVAARFGCALAIVAAGMILVVAASLSRESLSAGGNVLWYAALGLSSGMLRWHGFLLASSAVVLGMRFVALQFSDLHD